MRTYKKGLLSLFVFLTYSLLLIACGESVEVKTRTPTVTRGLEQTSTPTPPPPTNTPIPLAALVEGEAITLEEFQAELERFKAAGSNSESLDESETNKIVLDDLINLLLLSHAAREAGFELSEEELEESFNALVKQVNGENAFQNWLRDNHWTEEAFKKSLQRSIEAAWMRDRIVAEVPDTTEQVHAYQILVSDAEEAARILAQLDSGMSFATLAAAYDPLTNGDLGWFPRNYLMDEAIEDAAFQLQPGEYSRVIESQLGYHIIQVVERDPDHPLSPEARLIWQEKALKDWIVMRRSQADIQVLIP